MFKFRRVSFEKKIPEAVKILNHYAIAEETFLLLDM